MFVVAAIIIAALMYVSALAHPAAAFG